MTRENKPAGDAHLEPVVVFETGSDALVAIAKSILQDAEIPFGTINESIQDVFGYGRFPGGVNFLTGPVQFLVAPENAEVAKALLEGLEESELSDDDSDDGDQDDS